MEVAFEPYKKVSFQSYLRYKNSQEFADVIASFYPPGVPSQSRLYWANGVLFRFFSHPPSDALVQETINGHLIWDHIEFAPMPEYESVLRVTSKPLVTLTVLDVSNHAVFSPVTRWIHNNLI